MNFESLIKKCRENLTSFALRKNLLGRRRRDFNRAFKIEGIAAEFHDRYASLAESGRVVWSSCAQASENIFNPGVNDLPGNSIYGLDPYFDARPHHLLRVCEKIYALKDKGSEDVVLGKVAAIITDELNFVNHWRLPRKLTDGQEVFLSSTLYHRCRLPDAKLGGRLVPLVITPDSAVGNMILPLACWPGDLVEAWATVHERTSAAPKLLARPVTNQAIMEDERDARDRPHRKKVAGDLVPIAATSAVSLTRRCADFARNIASQKKLRGDWFLKVGGADGAWSLDIVQECNQATHSQVESEGIRILFPRARPDAFHGLVIDYQASPTGAGFVFHTSR
ncbi:hypothetical protein B7486_11925 [cyanobacterium TDX16]|nr:hypothetical protein B7486_11925 [cyanobacterium TDX16]